MSAQGGSKKKRGALGRGLGNLLDDEAPVEKRQSEKNRTGVVEIETEKIRANPDNPRKKFDKNSIEELAATVKEFGLLQPILVMPDGDNYVVISGERRLRACRSLSLKSVPCLIKELNAKENLEVSLIENIQREQLDPIEEANVYKNLLEQYKMTQEALSERVGKNRATIANRVRLLQLPASIQNAVADQRLTEGQVRPLLSIQNKNLMERLAGDILRNEYSARQVEELVRNTNGKKSKTAKVKVKKESSEATALGNELSELFQTRVNIKHHDKSGKGIITIEYFSLENLDHILNTVRK